MSEESEEFMEQIQDLEAEEERLHKKIKKNFIISNFCIAFFGFFTCLSIYCIAIDYNKESFIPTLMACLIFMAMAIYYAIFFGRKYYYRQRDVEIARRDRPRARVPLTPQNEDFEEESDSRSSPADTIDPAAEGPSNLPHTESSTLSEQTSTQDSSERTSLSDSTKGTFTTTAIIERAAVAKTAGDVLSAAEENVATASEIGDGAKPSTSSQLDSTDCLTIDADPEDEIGNVRHRRLTPE